EREPPAGFRDHHRTRARRPPARDARRPEQGGGQGRRVRHHPRAARGARLYRCARLAPVRGIGGAASRTETDGVGRRITLSTLVVALVTVSAAGAANIQTSARYVRAAIPAV